jgi:hypothetical protein
MHNLSTQIQTGRRLNGLRTHKHRFEIFQKTLHPVQIGEKLMAHQQKMIYKKSYKHLRQPYAPTFTPQTMNTILTLPLEPTLSTLKQACTNPKNNYIPVIIQNISIKKSIRLFCLLQNQECINCHITGNQWRIEQHVKTPYKSTWHINLYAHRPEIGQHNILITRDHIIAIANNGPDTLENSQTMCTHCNNKKGAKLHINDLQQSAKIEFTPTIEELKLFATMLEDAITNNKLNKNKTSSNHHQQ